jgi:hypothetical protein
MSERRLRRLQIFGERCSGTNYVAQLLRRNLGLEPTDAHGWKHGWLDRVEGPAADTLFVVVHRDPFDWLRSLHRMPWHAAPALQGLPFAQFVRTPWWCEWGQHMDLEPQDPRRGTEMLHERDPDTGRRFDHVLALRTAKHRAWEALAGRVQHVAALRYEDAAAAPAQVVRDLAQRFALRRWPWLRAVAGEKGGRQRYVEKPPVPLAEADLRFIAEQLDPDLERRCGYDLVARVAAERARTAAAAVTGTPGAG